MGYLSEQSLYCADFERQIAMFAPNTPKIVRLRRANVLILKDKVTILECKPSNYFRLLREKRMTYFSFANSFISEKRLLRAKSQCY